jgi:hypothetical protein
MAPRPRLRALALAAGALLAPVAVVVMPRDGAPVVVLAGNAAAAAAAIGRADGAIIASLGSFGLLARSETPGFAARLYSSGAVLVLAGLGGGCSGLRRDISLSARPPS